MKFVAVSISKVFLEHSYAHLFMYHLWLLLCYITRVEQLPQRPCALQNQNFYSLAFYKKSFPSSELTNLS